MQNKYKLKDNIAVGTDIESVKRFEGLSLKKNRGFFEKIFTKKELRYCFSKKNAAPHLAARYCGKEAIIKALNSMGKKNIDYREIEIINNSRGIPEVRMNNKSFSNLRIYISLSHCEDKALAFVVVREV